MLVRKRKIVFIAAVGLLLLTTVMPVYAESRKKITSVRITVEANIKPGTMVGDEEIEIKIPSDAKYECSSYDFTNDVHEWGPTDIPQLNIELTAKEDYYFSLKKASEVSLKGAEYKKATKENQGETLNVLVTLTSLEESVSDMGEVELTRNGYVIWDPVVGAGSYELRFYRDGRAMGATDTVTSDTVYNMQPKIKRGGTYYVKVRARNKLKEKNKSDWAESGYITLTYEEAKGIQGTEMPQKPMSGEWRLTGERWWYQYENGTYPTNGWLMIDNKWYFFDAEGYMKTGWIEWEGKEYYCDDKTGVMLTNTTTPDGYWLDANGNKLTGN